MVNPLRGEAVLPAGDQTFTLTFDVSAFCRAEKALALPTDEIVQGLLPQPGGAAPRKDLAFLCVLVWAGLSRHHDVTVAEAEDIVTTATPTVAKAAILDAWAQAFGVVKEGEDRPSPQTSERGTGSRSSRGGAKPGKA